MATKKQPAYVYKIAGRDQQPPVTRQHSTPVSSSTNSTLLPTSKTTKPKQQHPPQIPPIDRSGTYVVDEEDSKLKTLQQQLQRPPSARRSNQEPAMRRTNSEKATPPSKTTMSLAQFKQQKRAENKLRASCGASGDFGIGDVSIYESPNHHRSLDYLLRKARGTGLLNLSDMSLDEVPAAVWTVNDLQPQQEATASVALNESADNKWWQQVELQKLLLVSNRIKALPQELKQLDTLLTLDVHDNQLEYVDNAIGSLAKLQNLNLAFNRLENLPDGICKLKYLTNLNLSNNRLKELPRDFGKLDYVEILNLSNNELTRLPKSFGWLSSLRILNLASNSLKHLIPEVFYPSNIRVLDLSENQIDELPKEANEMANIEQFSCRQNKLKRFPRLEKCYRLKDLDFSFNQISEIEEGSFDNLGAVVNFNLRDNQIVTVPKSIEVMQSLERLDLTNNNIGMLPAELANIESLKQLLLTGNPLRTIRKDIINRGTEAIRQHLRNQLPVQSPSSHSYNSSSISADESFGSSNRSNALNDSIVSPRPENIRASRVYDLSSKKLTCMTSDLIIHCKQSTALVLNLSKNLLTDLSNDVHILNEQLRELNLSLNRFQQVPMSVFTLTNLVKLDLRANQLTFVPYDLTRIKSLRELAIGDNKLEEVPPAVYELPILEHLFANNNKIRVIEAERFLTMKHLNTLNLQNNDIAHVPYSLGKCTQIKSLMLEGNEFKIPRAALLAKGTYAILEYLRDRMTAEENNTTL